MKNLKSVLLLSCLLPFSGCAWFRPAPLPSSPSSPSSLSSLPPAGFELESRLNRIKMSDLNGLPFTLHDLAGKPVFLNFWATWCGPCISEMRSIEEVYQQFKDEVVFLAVSTEDPAKIEAFRQKNPFSFQFARLDVEYVDAFVIKLPTTMLISRNGKLTYEEEGYRVWTHFNNLEKIKEIADHAD